MQAHELRTLRERMGSDDIFDLLEELEGELLDLAAEPEATSRRARDRQEDERGRRRVLQAAAAWAVERGRKYKKCCAFLHPADVTRPPRLVTFDNEPVSFCRAHYAVSDDDAVLAALRACPELDETEEGRGFNWSAAIDAEQSRGLGFINAATPGKLVLECMSRSRVERGKRLLESLAGAWLQHRSDTEQDPWQAIAERQRRGGDTAPRNEVPPEIAGPAIRQFLDRQYATWPDEPLPALGGRTAREAVKTVTGRQDVIELLTSFEQAEQRRPQPLRYDFSWLAGAGIETAAEMKQDSVPSRRPVLPSTDDR